MAAAQPGGMEVEEEEGRHVVSVAAPATPRGAQGGDADVKGKKEKEDEAPRVPFTKLLSTADRFDYLLMAVGTIGAMGNGICWPLFAIQFGDFVDLFGGAMPIGTSFTSMFSQLALNMFYISLGALVGGFLQASCFIWSGNRQANRIRSMYLSSVLRQEIGYFDTLANAQGSLLQGLNADNLDVQNAISDKLAGFIQNVSTFIAGIVVAFVAGWDMTLVMIGTLPLVALTGAVLSRITAVMSARTNAAQAKASSIAQQTVAQVRTVVAYGGEERSHATYMEALDAPNKEGKRSALYAGMANGSINLVLFCTFAIAFYYGAWRVSTRNYTGGQVLNVFLAAMLGGFSLGLAFPVLETFSKGRAAAARLYEVVNRVPLIDCEGEEGLKPEQVHGKLELEHVAFAYPARPDFNIFTDFSLVVPAGTSMALVGASGSGKSTVVSLVERFYDPSAGRLLLDGHDLRSLNLRWLRSNVGLVSQEPTLFATTIFENIALGKPGASQDEVSRAAAAANAAKFIAALPEGYNTHVGERGLQLSGGQKQRIAIARAILKNPKILLLDEATSALDTQSERIVQSALERMIVGRTTVVVAHRLSTIKNADSIAVVRDGVVAELGSHQQLLSKPDGMYTALVNLQTQAGNKVQQAAGPAAKAGVTHTSDEHTVATTATDVHSDDEDSVPVKTTLDGKGEDGKKDKKKDKKVDVPLSRIVSLNKPEWPYGLVGLFWSAINGSLFPIFAFLLATFIHIFFQPTATLLNDASFLAWMFFVLGCAALISTTLMQFCFGVVGEELARRVRSMMFRNMLTQEIGWFDQDANSSGALSTKLSTEAAYVRGAVGDKAAVFLTNICALITGYVIAFIHNWRMALLVTGALPFVGLGAILYFRLITGNTESSSKHFGSANQSVSDAISSIRVVQAYNLQGQVVKLYNRLITTANVAVKKLALVTGVLTGYSNFSLFAVFALIVWFSGVEVDSGRSNFERLLKAFFPIMLSVRGIAQAQASFPDMGKAKGAMRNIFPIIDRKSKIPPNEGGATTTAAGRTELEGAVQLHDVKFAYPERASVMVFRDFNLDIPAGQMVALVGESGCGKSTTVSLVLRFYDPLEGTVVIDGRDVRDYNLAWLRSNISLVSQEPLLFSMSVMDNIKYGRPDASMEEVEAAARAANAHEFIMEMAHGYTTLVGERGVQLSGGQKQRVAIARACLKDPKLLLLDEATSALDVHSEKVVQLALDKLMSGRTSIVVAHRLSTIMHAHKIALVHRGVIVEQGTHAELTAIPNGGYASLVAAQRMGPTG